MTDQIGEKQPGGRGPTKRYPTMTFEEALVLPGSILEYGVNGEIQRLTLLGKLNRSPNSNASRELITSSSKYGLTSGSYNAPSLKVTEIGRKVIRDERLNPEVRLNLAIEKFDPFKKLYEKLVNQRLPDATVLGDELGTLGVDAGDRGKAAEVFTSNIRFIGLVQEIKGSDVVTSHSHAVDQLPSPESEDESSIETEPRKIETGEPSATTTTGIAVVASEPSVHIDVQIHIDSTASPEQIDQIFASMARHLYGKQG